MRVLVRVVLAGVPLALCVALPLIAYLRGRASGSSFGANVGDDQLTSVLTWALLDLLALAPLLMVNRVLPQAVIPPAFATLVVGAAWLGSGPPRGGVLDVRLIDLVNLPASLVMNAANHVGSAAAEVTTGLTFAEARAAGFNTSLDAIAPVGDGAVVVGCVALHRRLQPIQGRLFGLDARGQLRSTFGEHVDLPDCRERLIAATPRRTAILHRNVRFGISELAVYDTQENLGPNIVGVTALALSAHDEPWVAHRPSSGDSNATLVSRVEDGWPRTRARLEPAPDASDGPRVLALRPNADGSGVLVALASSHLVRIEFSDAGVQPQVSLPGDGEVVMAGIDGAGRVVVHRPGARQPWVRHLPDGAVDEAFAPPPNLVASALGVADDGAVWLISKRPGGDVVLRLTPEGRLDPAVSFEGAVSVR